MNADKTLELERPSMGKRMGTLLIVIGTLIILIGLLISAGWMNWFGRLPGDVRIERENLKVYVPLASMLLVSLGLSFLLWVVRKLW